MDSAPSTDPIEILPNACGFAPSRLIDRFRAALADSFLRKGALSVFDQAIVSGTSFVTSVVLGRTCAKEELGVYFLALSVVMFVRGIQEQLVSAPYMIYCNRRAGDELAKYAGSSLIHQFAVTALALAGLAGLLVCLGLGYGPAGLSATVWVLLGAAPFLLLREFVRQYAFSHFRMRTAIAVDAVVAALQLGGLLALAATGMLSAPAIFAVMGAACAAACAIWWTLSRGEMRIGRARWLPDWKHNWRFARWAAASQLVGCSAPYILPWVLAIAHGEAETGVLAACTTLVGLGNMFVMGLSNYLSPKAAHAFAHGGRDELTRVLWKTALLFSATLGSFLLFCLATGDWLAVFVYGDKYAGAGMVLALLAAGLWASSIAITAGNGLWAIERPQANFFADVCTLTATIVATALLVRPFGVVGIALASLIGSTTSAAVLCFTLRRFVVTEFVATGFSRSRQTSIHGASNDLP
ncbi:MAG: lipopolysaccharide biosynthesis protein [Planctomycetaceae bacterium]